LGEADAVAGGLADVRVVEQPVDGGRGQRLGHQLVIVMAEGAVPREDTMATHEGELDAFGHARLGGIGARLEWEIEVRTGKAARATVLGQVQRGGSPTAYDRVLATRFGLHAIDAVHEGDSGVMVALRGTDIVRVPLAEATRELKTVPVERYAEAEVFFG